MNFAERPAATRPAPASPDPAAAPRHELEQMWERKLDEVAALDGACHGVSASGDDVVPGGAKAARIRLHERTARAYEELGVIADAIDSAGRRPPRPQIAALSNRTDDAPASTSSR